MNGRWKFVRMVMLTLSVGLLASASAFADIPGPGPRPVRPYPRPVPVPAPAPAPAAKATEVPMTIELDTQAKESVLKIPRKLLQTAGKVGLDETPAAPGTMRSVVASFAMSLGFIGAFFVRRSRKARALVAGIICVAAVTAAGTLFADISLPPMPPAQPAGNLPITLWFDGKVAGKVVIEIANSGDAVTLVMSTNGAPAPLPAPPAPPAPESARGVGSPAPAPAPPAPSAPAPK